MLDGAVVGLVAILAGAAPGDGLRLAASMTALQFGIGATNDVVDAPRDAGHKAGKPIPAGLVSSDVARALAIGAFAVGLGLAVPAGELTVGLAIVVIGIGLAYDLVLKGTAWSWLPFAAGIPILPVFGWLGAAGTLPPLFVLLIPVAVAAGAALAIANALADTERDEAAGTRSIAIALGPGRAWALEAALVGGVLAVAVGSAAALGVPAGRLALVVVAGAVPIVALLGGRSGGPGRRERAWQLIAVGMGAVGVAWLWALLG